ncbi:hypothetical protein NEOLEDRAFT_9900 [Neolentinus lepideus HHB14362 ss-1]|uniref:Uncharacterized protein n=1 Tax=Neolentinus lepideus HHB14362 ss-1 TaxID=1314782 RepID=A0A165VZS2_9AGAM|nr:hypothetical protein NEOLEDRAFT_9900 [Neolentinus lepideus HHB14362 ss-1]
MAAEAYYNRAFIGHSNELEIRTTDCSDAEDPTVLTPPPYASAYTPFQQGCYPVQPEEHSFVSQQFTPPYLSYENPSQFYQQAPDQVWVPSLDYSLHAVNHSASPASSEGELAYPPEPISIHAPIPLPPGFSGPPSSESLCGQLPVSEGPDCRVAHPSEHFSELSRFQSVSSGVDLDPVVSVNFTTFPTPSELLTDLTAREAAAQAHPELSEPSGGPKVESQRKARQRAVAESVGFVPTDPDTISSHDKKRHYLECLEQYVLYLHEQFRLLGQEPVKLERVSTYRGLSSRSIRTLLVHMQEQLRKHHERTLEEEQIFGELREALVTQEAATAVQQSRRRSAP